MFSSMPPVVKNILFINVLMLFATIMLSSMGLDLNELFGLHYWGSDKFSPYQFVTYMFMHGGLAHLFFNMFALWMFGRILEQVWGPKRFLIYYMITGIGAGLVQMMVTEIRVQSLITEIDPELYQRILTEGSRILDEGKNYRNEAAGTLNMLRNVTTVGASGSVFGILLAFGMLFPNTELMLIFPPIPIKAKYFVFGYGAIELYMGIANNPADNVAHFAHLGGMLFGFILIRYWKKRTNHFY